MVALTYISINPLACALAAMIGLFGVLALVIATVGVAGVLAFSVSQRTNELGIRLALGAERRAILRMILGEGAAMALVGLLSPS
jgi:putative ABC transport system permease protein